MLIRNPCCKRTLLWESPLYVGYLDFKPTGQHIGLCLCQAFIIKIIVSSLKTTSKRHYRSLSIWWQMTKISLKCFLCTKRLYILIIFVTNDSILPVICHLLVKNYFSYQFGDKWHKSVCNIFFVQRDCRSLSFLWQMTQFCL